MTSMQTLHPSRTDSIGAGRNRHGLAGWLAVVGLNSLVASISLACLYPFYVAEVASFKAVAAVFGYFTWPAIPQGQDLLTYAVLTAAQPLDWHLVNLVSVSLMVVVVSLFLGATADYAFGRLPFRGRSATLGALATALFPQAALLACVFEAMRALRLYIHWWGLTLPYVIFTLPFAVWCVMSFANSPFARPRRHPTWLAPLSSRRHVRQSFLAALCPALLMTGLIAFVAAWTEFMFSLSFLLDDTQRSPPASVQMAERVGWLESPWGMTSGCVAVAVLALAVVILARQRVARRRRLSARARPPKA